MNTIRNLRVLLCCSLLFQGTSCSVFQAPEVTTEATDEDVIVKWTNIEKSFMQTLDSVLQQVLPTLLRLTSEVEVSSDCMADMLKFMIAIRQGKLWAFQMMDATGKPFSGLSTGTLSDPGAYHKCLNISGPVSWGGSEPSFVGQYCSLDIRPPLPSKPAHFLVEEVIKPLDNFKHQTEIMAEIKKYASMFYHLALRFGVCVPSTCSRDDIEKAASSIAGRLGFYASVPRCEVSQGISLDAVQLVVICVFSLFLILVLMGTAYHILPFVIRLPTAFIPSKQNGLHSLLLTFSLWTNSRHLFDVTPDKSSLAFLSGVKFFAMSWIILGHTYLNFDFQLIRSPETIRPYPGDWAFQAIGNALPTVDTFFFVSGLLVSYVTICTVDKRGKGVFIVPIIILRRYWRLVPIMLLVSALVILLPLLGSGPIWHENVDLFAKNCRQNWWALLTISNNFLLLSEACLPFTWYVSVDMQLFLLAIVYLVLVLRKPLFGWIWGIFLLVVSIVSTGVATFALGFPPTQIMTNPDPAFILERTRVIANMPHQHAATYAIGFMLGYILARNPRLSFPWWVRVSGWCVSIITSSVVIYGTLGWNRGTPYSSVEAAFYAALFRPVWALALSWMTIMCASNTGGFVNHILSWPALRPLGKLSYLMYLLHFPVMYFYIASLTGTMEMNHKSMMWTFSGHLLVTMFVSAIFYLIFEGPLTNLDRLLINRIFKNKKETDRVMSDDNKINETLQVNGKEATFFTHL